MKGRMKVRFKLSKRRMALFGISASTLLLAACSPPGEEERLQKMGLPPSDFVADVRQGKKLFEANCAVCHGKTARGSDQGPPLIHKVYESSHHSDLAFYRAVKEGSRAHHWQFGDMPAQPQVSPEQAGHIVGYVRKIQRSAGIQ